MKAILLAAERGIRRLQPADSYPRALIDDDHGGRVLDWILGAVREAGTDKVVLVGGYHVEKLIASQPTLPCYYNAEWANSGTAHSLLVARDQLVGEVLVSQTDVVYHAGTLRRFLAAIGPVVLGVASAGPDEADPRLSALAGEPVMFAGLMRLSAEGSAAVLAAADAGSIDLGTADLPDLALAVPGARVEVVGDGWARIDAAWSMARFVLGSKAQTLGRLRGQVRDCVVLDQVPLTSGDWRRDRQGVLDQIAGKFGTSRLVVRSSAKGEDSWSNSQAGRYDSILDVDGSDAAKVAAAIDAVIASFADDAEDGHEVFVQPFLSDIRASGVIFTRDPETMAPYVVVNFDSGSGRSDTVTGGHGAQLATSTVLRGHLDRLPPEVAPLAGLIDEVERLVGHDGLDLEFAIDGGGQVYLLQVRPITPKAGAGGLDERDVISEIEAAATFVADSFRPHPGVLGTSTVFANMPDWNPAEIIGTTPRPLAISLYRALVMDEVWAASRAEMGYRPVPAMPLMKVLAGHPYVDARATFNSFIPAALGDDLAARLVNHYVERLRSEPRLQDKIEFEIAFTCLDFCFDEDSGRLREHGFTPSDIASLKDGLAGLTGGIVSGAIAGFEDQRTRLDALDRRHSEIAALPMESAGDICRAVSLLLDDCRRLGTLPFANLARQGFVATALMRSLARVGVFAETEVASMMADLPTVAGELSDSIARLAGGTLGRADFLARFGHLRPGTYDILSPSYGERPDLYIDDLAGGIAGHHAMPEPDAFERRFLAQRARIDGLGRDLGLGVDAQAMARFIALAIPGREWGKFVFSRNLSTAIGLLRRLGEMLDFSPDDMSFLPVSHVVNAVAMAPSGGWSRELKRVIDAQRKAFAVGKAIRMPSVISSPQDVFGFTERDAWPNFITAKSVTAPLVVLDGPHAPGPLKGCVVAIEKADPGYDWLFAHDIAGLVTKYGGVASHMAIRCAEFGLPAAIGCGERVFESLRPVKVIDLNCADRRIGALR